jgi:hypothetical protein
LIYVQTEASHVLELAALHREFDVGSVIREVPEKDEHPTLSHPKNADTRSSLTREILWIPGAQIGLTRFYLDDTANVFPTVKDLVVLTCAKTP